MSVLTYNSIMNLAPSPKNNDGIIEIIKATGLKLYDQMGKEYIDLDNGKGSVLLGHNHERINLAIIKYLTDFGNPTSALSPIMSQLTEKILHYSGLETYSIAYFTTGTSACRAAAVAAQTYSNKSIILSSGYHGWDTMWVPNYNLLEKNPYGVVDFYFNLQLLEDALKKYENDIALVMISPDYAHLREDTLQAIAHLAKKHGCLFCCDDIKQGFRRNSGCSMSDFLAYPPDLVTFSKGLSNGNRISCLLGENKIICQTKAMTYTSYYNTLPFVAANETLVVMGEQDVYAFIKKQGQKLVGKLRDVINVGKYPIKLADSSSFFQFIFPNEHLESKFNVSALCHGLILYAGNNQSISLAFDDAAIDDITNKIEAALHDTFEGMDKDIHSISKDQYMQTALRMIGGASDHYGFEISLKYIKSYLRKLQYMQKHRAVE